MGGGFRGSGEPTCPGPLFSPGITHSHLDLEWLTPLGLADILDEISEDIREMHRLKQERKSTTVMQVLFMIAAGAIVTPFIFGLVSAIVGFLIDVSSQGLNISAGATATAVEAKNSIIFLMQAYLFIELMAVGAMVATMREGKLTKSVIYIPLLLLIAFIVYYMSFAFGTSLIGV